MFCILFNFQTRSSSGVACPLSHFEMDCLETLSLSASYSCVMSLAFRKVNSFSEKSIISCPPILFLIPKQYQKPWLPSI